MGGKQETYAFGLISVIFGGVCFGITLFFVIIFFVMRTKESSAARAVRGWMNESI
jgi:hypothetical protein